MLRFDLNEIKRLLVVTLGGDVTSDTEALRERSCWLLDRTVERLEKLCQQNDAPHSPSHKGETEVPRKYVGEFNLVHTYALFSRAFILVSEEWTRAIDLIDQLNKSPKASESVDWRAEIVDPTLMLRQTFDVPYHRNGLSTIKRLDRRQLIDLIEDETGNDPKASAFASSRFRNHLFLEGSPFAPIETIWEELSRLKDEISEIQNELEDTSLWDHKRKTNDSASVKSLFKDKNGLKCIKAYQLKRQDPEMTVVSIGQEVYLNYSEGAKESVSKKAARRLKDAELYISSALSGNIPPIK